MTQKKFIAYFDYLGFKEFILNNDHNYVVKEMDNIFRDIEGALAKGRRKPGSDNTSIADLSSNIVNAINFSDTVVFWTNDDSEESFNEILEISYLFNSRTNLFFFPVRGSLIHGELEYVDYKEASTLGAIYNINSVFGKGLVDAHLKAESQNWAGTVVDYSIITYLEDNNLDVHDKLNTHSKKYNIPYKKEDVTVPEYALKFTKQTVSERRIESMRDSINSNFRRHNKDVSSSSVQTKLANTIKFVESFLED